MARCFLLSCLVLALGATSLPATGPQLRVATADKDKNFLLLAYQSAGFEVVTREVEVEVGGRKEKRLVQQLVLKTRMVEERRAVRGMRFLDTSGKEVDLKVALERLAKPTAVAMSVDGQPLAEVYLRALTKDTMVLLLPDFGPVAPAVGPVPAPFLPPPK